MEILYHKTFIKSPTADWVTFIHGAGGSSNVWFKQLKDFSKEFNVLVIDLRGHGKSSDVFKALQKRKYSFKLVSKDILKVLDHLKIGQSHFVGISLGTILIREIAEINPKRIQSMVLAGAITKLNFRSRVLVKLGKILKPIMPFMWLYKLFAHIIMPNANHKESRNVFINEAKRLYKKEINKWFRMLGDVNPLLKYLENKPLSIPTLYIMGGEDHLFLAPVKKIIQKNKNAILEVFANCGHVVNIEKPDLFNRVALSFLKVSISKP